MTKPKFQAYHEKAELFGKDSKAGGQRRQQGTRKTTYEMD